MAYLLNVQGTWYFRMVIPAKYRSRIGKTEIRRSLGTASKRKAQRMIFPYMMEYNTLIEEEIGITVNSDITLRDNVEVSKAPLLSEVCKLHSDVQRLQGLMNKTSANKETVIRLLIRICGDKPIDTYTLKDARKFREMASKVPPRLDRYPADQSLEDIINNADKTVSIETYNNFIKYIRVLFKFAIAEGYIKDDIFSNMVIKYKKKANSFRGTYTQSQVKTLFNVTQKEIGFKYWFIRLSYYTGMRLGEISQLYKSDIITKDSIPHIHVQALKPDQRLKTASSNRLVPIHPAICNEFLAFVERLEGDVMLFPDLWYSEASGYAQKGSKWFHALKNSLMFEQTNGKLDFHSVRHTFVDRLKQAMVSETLAAALVGHSQNEDKNITFGRYGKDYTLDTLYKAIQAIPMVEE